MINSKLPRTGLWRAIVNALYAWHRGDVRVAPGATGRVYEKKDSDQAGRHRVASKATAVLREIKVIRADGTEEIIKTGG